MYNRRRSAIRFTPMGRGRYRKIPLRPKKKGHGTKAVERSAEIGANGFDLRERRAGAHIEERNDTLAEARRAFELCRTESHPHRRND